MEKLFHTHILGFALDWNILFKITNIPATQVRVTWLSRRCSGVSKQKFVPHRVPSTGRHLIWLFTA